MNKIISEIIDQQVDLEEFANKIDSISGSGSSLKNWRNIHLIGDVIRGEVQSTGNCVIERVQLALEEEPTVLAPADSAVADSQKISSQKSLDVWKSAGLFAVAASITLVAVLTLTPGTSKNFSDQSAIVAALSESTGSDIERVPSQKVDVTNLTAQDAVVLYSSPRFDAEFGQMLVEHGEFSSTSGLNGLIAYAKLVSNENLTE